MADTRVDLREFQRSAFVRRPTSISHALGFLEHHVTSLVSQFPDPAHVRFHQLWAMGNHPMVYLAERTVLGVIRRKDLYSVEHDDDRIKAEVMEWLWPLMGKGLLSAAARAFAYGNIPVVFNWGRETLQTRVNDRNRNRPNYSLYKSVHDLLPYPHSVLNYDNDDLEAIEYGGETYDRDRVHHFIWDQEFGNLCGQAARRRAWRDYTTSEVIELLQTTYLERSVDAPRVAFAPPGTQDAGEGDPQGSAEYVMDLVMGLRGSGAVVFPSKFDADGNKLYELDTLNLPDRDQVWLRALSRLDSRILLSYLASPTLAGIEDMAAAASRSLEGMLKEFVQDIADWVAANLTEIVEKVHHANHPGTVKPPTIVATDVGKASALKTLLEVVRMAQERVSTRLDVDAALDKLGAPVLDPGTVPPELELLADMQPTPPDGRTPDTTSDRESRRERGQTPEAEEDTGRTDTDRNAGAAIPTFNASAERVRQRIERQELVAAVTDSVNQAMAAKASALPTFHIHTPPQAAPIVNFAAQEQQPAPVNVTVNVPEQPAPIVNVTNDVDATTRVEPGAVNIEPGAVNVEPTQLTIENHPPQQSGPKSIEITREDGTTDTFTVEDH